MGRVEVEKVLAGTTHSHVSALIQAAEEHDRAGAIGEHKLLRLTHGPAAPTEAILVWDGANLVGFANVQVFPTSDGKSRLALELVVHPSSRRKGVASQMLVRALLLAHDRGVARVDAWAYNQMSGTRELAHRFGFKPSRILLEIKRELTAGAVPPLPEGYLLDCFRPGTDDQEWLALNNLAFASHPEQGHWDGLDLRLRLQEPWFRAEDFLVVRHGAAMAAFNWLKLDEHTKTGEIYVIGVHPDAQRARLGETLTLEGFEHMRRRGMEHVSAYVDATNSSALRMYYRLGFVITHADLCYSRSLEEETAG